MTQKKTLILVLVAAGLLAAFGGGGYWAGLRQSTHANAPVASGPNGAVASAGGKLDPATGRTVLYWHDPMVPGPKFDQPGKSPFMDMQLVPVYADQAADTGEVAISPRLQQNLGIRTAAVKEDTLATALEAVGSVAWNERDVTVVQARGNGYVERLIVRAPFDRVKKGQPLAELYVPDWVAAQEDYLAARRMSAGLADAARQRMLLAGMTDDLVRQVEASGKVHARLTVTSPRSGVVAELGAREGMAVTAGAPLYRINGLSTVWVNAELPESAAAGIRPGASVAARTPALPGMTFQGKVGALLPEINAATRTLTARIELANPSGQLVPGMFVTASLTPAAGKAVLLVPSDAVIQTGRRSVVFVAAADDRFIPVDVETGAEAHGQTEIRKGLAAGQRVVVSGQFLVDSEASLKGVAARMSEAPATPPAGAAPVPLRGDGGAGQTDADGTAGARK